VKKVSPKNRITGEECPLSSLTAVPGLIASNDSLLFPKGWAENPDFRRLFPKFSATDRRGFPNELATLAEWHRGGAEGPAPPPLLLVRRDSLRETAFERVLSSEISRFSAIFANPAYRLDYVDSLMPAGSARRVATGAIQRLAAHSEDWYRAGLLRVFPKIVLGEESRPFYDIYENRLAVYLHERLRREIGLRLSMMRGCARQLDDCLRMQEEAGYRVQRSVSEFLKQALEAGDDRGSYSDSELRSRAGDVLAKLEHADSQLKRIRSAALFKALKKFRYLETPYISTNLLRMHRDYKSIAGLWSVIGRPLRLDEMGRTSKAERFAEDFDGYCHLLIRWSLQKLGLPLGPYPYSQAYGFRLEIEGVPLKVVPLAINPCHLDEARMSDLLQTRCSEPTVVLYLDRENLRLKRAPGEMLALNAFRRPPFGTTGGKAVFVPVSPYDIYSRERLIRVFRWYFKEPELLSFQPVLDGDATKPFRGSEFLESKVAATSCGFRLTGDRLVCLQASSHRVKKSDLVVRLSREEFLRAERCDLGEDIQIPVRGNRVKTFKSGSAIEKIPLDLRNRFEGDGVRVLLGGRALFSAIKRLVERLSDVACCPVCKVESGSGAINKDSGNYQFKCDRCRLEWGARLCPDCRTRYGFLGPVRAVVTHNTESDRSVSEVLDSLVGGELMGADLKRISGLTLSDWNGVFDYGCWKCSEIPN